jgi:hypothetical protein
VRWSTCELGFAKSGEHRGLLQATRSSLGCSALEQQLRVPIGIEEDDDPAQSPRRRTTSREKTLVHAKKHAKEPTIARSRSRRSRIVKETDASVKKAIEKAYLRGAARSLAFAGGLLGRDVERRFFHLTSRGGFEPIGVDRRSRASATRSSSSLRVFEDRGERIATVSGATRALRQAARRGQ